MMINPKLCTNVRIDMRNMLFLPTRQNPYSYIDYGFSGINSLAFRNRYELKITWSVAKIRKNIPCHKPVW
jgi:hypothetical protein